jgi:hypothetical protein
MSFIKIFPLKKKTQILVSNNNALEFDFFSNFLLDLISLEIDSADLSDQTTQKR